MDIDKENLNIALMKLNRISNDIEVPHRQRREMQVVYKFINAIVLESKAKDIEIAKLKAQFAATEELFENTPGLEDFLNAK